MEHKQAGGHLQVTNNFLLLILLTLRILLNLLILPILLTPLIPRLPTCVPLEYDLLKEFQPAVLRNRLVLLHHFR